jgi:hypothetical protein
MRKGERQDAGTLSGCTLQQDINAKKKGVHLTINELVAFNGLALAARPP